jgi:cobalt-zinc-cadmium efflux system outer membrane protein
VLAAEQERLRLDVATEVARAFTGLLGAQERLRLTHEGYELAAELAKTAAERVAAGAVSPIEETRARVELAGVAGDLERARGEVEAARVTLAAAMGSPTPAFGPAAGPFGEDLTVPDRTALEAALGQSPDLTRWQHEAALREASVEAEEASASSDVTLKGGVGYARDPGEGLVLLSVSVPLAVRNKNQGAIREARAGLARVAHERRAEEARLRAELLRGHASLTAFAREAAVLRGQGLSSAQQAYDAVNEGYRQGKFRYLDVLDAGNALLGARLRYVEAVTSFELAKVDLNRLTARGPAPVQKEN